MRFAEATGDKFLMGFSMNLVLKQVSLNMKVSYADLKVLVDVYLDEGEILDKSETNKKRGFGSPPFNILRHKISAFNLCKVINYIDEKHAVGITVRRKMVKTHLKLHSGVDVSISTIGNLFKNAGSSTRTPRSINELSTPNA